MNKREFLENLNALKYGGSYSSTNGYWDKENGFNKCKEEVLKLAERLDEQGLTFEAYNLFRQQTNDMANIYTELFRVQNELFNAQKQLALQEADKQHYERLKVEEADEIRKNAVCELINDLHSLPLSDGKVVSAKGFIDLAELDDLLWKKYKIESSNNA